ncbi:MAG: hypothetical protein HEQ23_05510 [Tepidisphaera sp.]
MVQQFRFGMRGGRVVEIDVDATREQYARDSGTQGCACAECRNLREQFDAFVPVSIRAALADAGVDWTKPRMTLNIGSSDPPLYYEVDYAAIGRLVENGDDHDLGPTWICVHDYANPVQFVDVSSPQIRLSFLACEVPWVLNERPSQARE